MSDALAALPDIPPALVAEVKAFIRIDHDLDDALLAHKLDAAENAIDPLTADPGRAPDVVAAQFRDRTRQNGRAREVELVDCAMDRVDLDSCLHIETGLLEAETEPSGSCE